MKMRIFLTAQVVGGLALVSMALPGQGTAGCLVAMGGLVAGHAFALLAPLRVPSATPRPAPAPKAKAKATRTNTPVRRPASLTR